MDNMIELRGEGFLLRRWQADDADALAVAANHPAISRWLSGRFPYPYTHEDALRFLSGQVLDLADPVFAIVVDGRIAGGIGAHAEQPGRVEAMHSALLGYWLAPAHWGQGLMSRVVAGFTPWLMEARRLHRLAAHVFPDNLASAAVLARNGFIEEGRMHLAVVKDGRPHDLRLFARVRAALPGQPDG